jgi:hypothetical protein
LLEADRFVYVVVLFKYWNLIFAPLQIAFEYEYRGAILAMEVLTLLVYTIDIYNCWKEVKRASVLRHVTLVQKAAVLFPFALIFSEVKVRDPRTVVVIFSLLRILDLTPMLRVAQQFLKRYMKFLDFQRIV